MLPDSSNSSSFPQTRWSLVVRANAADEPVARRALEELCQLYWYPVYAFIRRSGNQPSDAEDLTQAFFACMLSRELFSEAESDKGRLRSLILKAAQYFIKDEKTKANALKRGGGTNTIEIDLLSTEDRYALAESDQASPAELFEKQWAFTLLEQTFSQLEGEMAARDRQKEWDALSPYIAWNAGAGPQDEAAKKVGMTVAAFRAALVRLRRRYRKLLTNQIAQTLDKPEDLDGEMAHLMAVISQ